MAKAKAKSAKAAANFWLMKTEPQTFSFADLVAAPGHTTAWDGVRNYQVRNSFRDEFKLGDQVFIYHSSCPEPGIVGTGEVVREAAPDLTVLDPSSEYYDEASARQGASRWLQVGVQAKGRFARLIGLAELRADPQVQGMLLLRRGMRLSVQRVSEEHWWYIHELAGGVRPIG